MSRERDCGVSPTAVPWKVPEGAYTSPASLFLTRQAVLATFSRSVASASCQRKQRARFVKPKVKLRSNEGTVLLGGTSGIILPQPPAARMRRGLNVKRQLLSHGRKGMWLFSYTFKSATVWLHYYTELNQWSTTCLIRDVMALISQSFKTQWQIQLPLPKIWRLQWSESPPMRHFGGCWIFLWNISGDRQRQRVSMKHWEAQL